MTSPTGTLRRGNLGCLLFVLLLAATFFSLGAIISMLTGDLLVALQAVAVALALSAAATFTARRRRA